MGNEDGASLAQIMAASLRGQPHLNNVLTHISAKNWRNVEHAFAAIFDADSKSDTLSPLAANILQLICDNRGTTGRIMQPFVFAFLGRSAGENRARIENRIWWLRAAQNGKAARPGHHTERRPDERALPHRKLTGAAS